MRSVRSSADVSATSSREASPSQSPRSGGASLVAVDQAVATSSPGNLFRGNDRCFRRRHRGGLGSPVGEVERLVVAALALQVMHQRGMLASEDNRRALRRGLAAARRDTLTESAQFAVRAKRSENVVRARV